MRPWADPIKCWLVSSIVAWGPHLLWYVFVGWIYSRLLLDCLSPNVGVWSVSPFVLWAIFVIHWDRHHGVWSVYPNLWVFGYLLGVWSVSPRLWVLDNLIGVQSVSSHMLVLGYLVGVWSVSPHLWVFGCLLGVWSVSPHLWMFNYSLGVWSVSPHLWMFGCSLVLVLHSICHILWR